MVESGSELNVTVKLLNLVGSWNCQIMEMDI
jgi:hypothetical protein